MQQKAHQMLHVRLIDRGRVAQLAGKRYKAVLEEKYIHLPNGLDVYIGTDLTVSGNSQEIVTKKLCNALRRAVLWRVGDNYPDVTQDTLDIVPDLG